MVKDMKRKTGFVLAAAALAAVILLGTAPADAAEPPGADLTGMAWSEDLGLFVLSRFELYRTTDGKQWTPMGLKERAVPLLSLAAGEEVVLVGTARGTVLRSLAGGPFVESKPLKDPYGRTLRGVRALAVHPKDREVMATSGQGLMISRDRGATFSPVTDPFWSVPEAREVLALAYPRGKPLVVTRNGEYRRRGEGFVKVTKGLPETLRPTTVAVSGGGVLLALPGDGIYGARKDSAFKRLKGTPGDPLAFVGFARGGYLAARPTTQMHLTTDGGKTWKPVGRIAPTFTPRVSASTPFGDFIILSGKGLVKLEGGEFVRVDLPGNLSSVYAKLEVPGGVLAGTQGGVFYAPGPGGPWTDAAPGEVGSAVNVFLPLGDGRILLGADGAGVFISGDGGKSWRGWSLRLGTANTVRGLVTLDGVVLAGTENGLMETPLGTEPDWRPRADGVTRVPVVTLLREGDNLWAATQRGVFRAGPDGSFAPVEGLEGRATALAVADGSVLAVVEGSVLLSTGGGAFKALPRPRGVIPTAVALAGGKTVLGTTGGVFILEGGQWKAAAMAPFPVERLVREGDGVRVVTDGAGTFRLGL